jgi:hypothetical protein
MHSSPLIGSAGNQSNESGYHRSSQRIAELPHRLHSNNWHRLHANLIGQPPMLKLGLTRNNLVRLHG